MSAPLPPRLLTVRQAAAYLSLSRSQLYALFDSGALPSVHVGRLRRVDRRDLDVYVDSLRSSSQPLDPDSRGSEMPT
jgi:excisionase family DNA binding protein